MFTVAAREPWLAGASSGKEEAGRNGRGGEAGGGATSGTERDAARRSSASRVGEGAEMARRLWWRLVAATKIRRGGARRRDGGAAPAKAAGRRWRQAAADPAGSGGGWFGPRGPAAGRGKSSKPCRGNGAALTAGASKHAGSAHRGKGAAAMQADGKQPGCTARACVFLTIYCKATASQSFINN